MVVRYQPTNGLNWFANHRKYLLDYTKLGKAWGDYRSGIGTGIGTVLPIPGGGLGGPQWGLLQIPFPYDSLRPIYESSFRLVNLKITILKAPKVSNLSKVKSKR